MDLSPPPIPATPGMPQLNFGLQNSDFNNFYDSISRYLLGYSLQTIITDIKTIAIIVSIVLMILLVWILIKFNDLYKKDIREIEGEINLPSVAPSAYKNRWEEIKRHSDSFVEAEWKLAIIEADKFVDDILKAAGFSGESMGERLTLIQPGQIANIQSLWDAHKLRNLLVHDSDFKLTHQQVIFALSAFESVLTELGALT